MIDVRISQTEKSHQNILCQNYIPTFKYANSLLNKMWKKQIVHDKEDPRNHVYKKAKNNPSVLLEFYQVKEIGNWNWESSEKESVKKSTFVSREIWAVERLNIGAWGLRPQAWKTKMSIISTHTVTPASW